jgi:hypothetical protein
MKFIFAAVRTWNLSKSRTVWISVTRQKLGVYQTRFISVTTMLTTTSYITSRHKARTSDFIDLTGCFTCRKSTSWGRRLYFHSEGRRAYGVLSLLKIHWRLPGFNPRTMGPIENTLTIRPPRALKLFFITLKNSIRTSKRTQHFTITKITWLTLFKEIIAVYSENHKKCIHKKSNFTDCYRMW